MRRAVFLTLGLLELAVAAVLGVFGWNLPRHAEVDQSFTSVERATRRTGDQVQFIRAQLHDLRRPELREQARRLQEQTRLVAASLRKQKIDYPTVEAVGNSLGQVAGGLEHFADTLDPKAVGRLGDGLGETADFLDKNVVPAAAKAADDLDASTKALQADAKQLGAVLRQAPPDLKAAQEIHDGLARFSDGLDRMNGTLKMQHLEAMKEGFAGLEKSLDTGAEQVERMAGYTYPVVTFNGLKPNVEERKFWPQGDEIADGMRKAAVGVKAAGKELDRLAAEMPRLRENLDESRKVADRARLAMAQALKQRDKVEALLKEAPEHTARLVEELPKLAADLGRILRDTQRLKETAASLRQAQKGIDAAVARWPDLRVTLSKSAALLKATQAQLNQALANRQEYEAALRQTKILADTIAILLPEFVEQLDLQLAEQEKALGDLGQSIDEVSAAVPVYGRTAGQLVGTARILLWLLAPIFGLHGLYLAATSWARQPLAA